MNCDSIFEKRFDLINIDQVCFKACPICIKLKNEKYTGEVLKELFPTIEIKPKTFNIKIFDGNNVKIRNRTKVDYYFLWNNKEWIIEYNGRQHYEPVDFTFEDPISEKSKIRFNEQQIRDEWLRNYCKENDIILVEIDGRKYKGIKIKEFLLEFFKNHSAKNYSASNLDASLVDASNLLEITSPVC